VILPESIYLERTDSVQQANGLKPQMFLRRQAVNPRYDTRPGAMILKQIAERMGLGDFFPYESMEDLVKWQLEGTGFSIEDFDQKGFVAYTDQQMLWDRNDEIQFKTPSGKIEFVSSLLEEAGFKSFPEYEMVPSAADNLFRLTVGRCALHTHVSTQNNPYLNEIVPENKLWINAGRARGMGISDGAQVKVSSGQGEGTIRVFATDLIHPEAVFMLHGYGHQVNSASRSFQKGLNDSLLMANISDMIGGSPALHDTFVQVEPVS